MVPMTEFFTNFHFLRPQWLWALLPAAGLGWILFRRTDSRRRWRQWVDPVLLEALLWQGDKRQYIRPVHLLGLFWLVAVLALAGPSWRHKASPFAEDKAALVIVLKVTPSMQKTDIAPSRLQRAIQKISDLLAARPGARNALIVYSGSAHLVMPLTSDSKVIEAFAQDLSPDLMPKAGDNATAALTLARQQLNNSGHPGSILLIVDELGADALAAMGDSQAKGRVPVHVWAATADPPSSLKQAATKTRGTYQLITPDTSDVMRIAQAVQETASADITGMGAGWQDGGYWLVPLLVLICALSFRRGWAVAHE